ncbi:MAG: ribonuclease [Geobacteraceae bacterium]|nr:MAG: ribonuclease [Geobacteraceae bacterium]
MTPQFHPTLINGPFDDPGVYIDFLFERRALLFDLGEIGSLTPRKILRTSHIFISHTHVDHFIGFDHLVRICLGREKKLHLFGPPGFVDQVWHRLASYTWNLVQNYPTDFTIVASEVHPDGKALAAEFHCLKGFPPEGVTSYPVADGVILDEETFRIRTVFLDHKTPCLAFSLEEKNHVNIMKNRLDELGLPVGPWLAELKRAVLRGEPDDAPFRAWWHEKGMSRERQMPLRELKETVLRIVPGQKITYVTDTVYTPENAARIVELARGSDYLFIEATFLHEEADRAAEKYHLTAHQAGLLAREAEVGRVTPFHFSPKYKGMEELLRREMEEAFAG